MYAGLAVDNKHETGFIAKEIRKHNYQTQVRLFTSLDDATVRAVLWDQSVHCLVWPPLVRYPGLSETAKTDLRAYAAAGNNVVFLGNYVAVQFMNDVFGFQLTDDYQNGPYYRNDRNVRNTPFQYLPSRVEQASIETVRYPVPALLPLPPNHARAHASKNSELIEPARHNAANILVEVLSWLAA